MQRTMTAADALQLGFSHHQAGRIAQAEDIYKQVLAAQPNLPDGWHLLGVAAHQSGRHSEAIESLRRAVKLNPNHSDYQNHLGAALGASGEMGEAIEHFRIADRLKPNDAQILFNLGTALTSNSQPEEAYQALSRAVELQPNFPEALFNLANLVRDRGEMDRAKDLYTQAKQLNPKYLKARMGLAGLFQSQGDSHAALAELAEVLSRRPDHVEAQFRTGSNWQGLGEDAKARAAYLETLRLDPNHVEALNNLGCVLKEDQPLEAERYLRRALQIKPDFAAAHNNLASALQRQKKFEEAEKCYREAIRLAPTMHQSYTNLGSVLQSLKRFEEALAAHDKAIELWPHFAAAHTNRGSVLSSLDRFADAQAAHARAIALDPENAEAHHNLGANFQAQGALQQAVAEYDLAIQFKPDYAEAHYNRGLSLLALGDFDRGWAEYAWRTRCEHYGMPKLPQPLWDGSPLAGKKLLVHAEQGLGDTLHFIRFAQPLLEEYPDALIEVQANLLPLLSTSGFRNLHARGTKRPPFDLHVPLVTLAQIYSAKADALAAQPYLFAEPTLVDAWKDKLSAIPGFRIGINWQGNPEYAFDRFRSVPLSHFAALAKLPGVSLVSLQRVHGLNQIGACKNEFHVFEIEGEVDQAAGAFQDTAAIIQNLDLIVTSDTALAHLAGGLGAPTWLATGEPCEWRWLLKRDDSPWYPSLRLFRQPVRGDWTSVFSQMASVLLTQKNQA